MFILKLLWTWLQCQRLHLFLSTPPLFFVYNVVEVKIIKKTINIICNHCGIESTKNATEIERQRRRGRNVFYCSRNCAGKASCEHLKSYKPFPVWELECSKRKKDDLSPFKPFVNRAKRREIESSKGYEVNITPEYLKDLWDKQGGKCCISGVELTLKLNHTPYQASLDRINNSIGYIKGNVRFVALIYNYAKNTFSDDEVIDFCKNVWNRLDNGNQ